MITKLIFIIISLLIISSFSLLIGMVHFYKKYNLLKSEYTICVNNLKKVTDDYNNLLDEYSLSLKKYKENLTKLNKRSNEIKSLVNRYKEIKATNTTADNECEQMKIMLDEFTKIDNEIRVKLGGKP